MIVLQARPSPGFAAAVGRVFGTDTVHVVDADAPLDAVIDRMTVLLHVLTPVTPAHVAAAPRLRLIQKLGVGVNTIALDAARAAGVAVCNMPGSNAAAVAEMALALMLGVLRRTGFLDAAVRRGEGWTLDPAEHDRAGEIGGRTVGLVGYGDTARRLARVLDALGARVIYTARHRHDTAHAFVPLDRLLAEADIVSLHAPLTDLTRAMIDPRAMKRGAILVNTARGELVDEAALAIALGDGHLRGAGLDVFAHEPLRADHPLLSLPNVLLSPHVAWLTPETLARSLAIAHDNCRRLAAGDPLLHRVA